MVTKALSILGVTLVVLAALSIPRPQANASISNITDLRDLSAFKKHREAHKNIPGPVNNAETDIVNIPSGSGVINYVWLADRPVNGGYPQFDHSIRIYTNGSSIPDVDTDLGLFFGYAYGEIFPAGNISTQDWQARVGGANQDRSGGSMRLPIPFTNGIRIAVANINNAPVSGIFSQVDYALTSENPALNVPPYTLKVAGNKWIGGRATVTPGNDATLATIPAGNPGVIVGHSMAGGGASDYSYLERQMELKVDGETTASVKSSGTEDWFGGSDYFYSGQSPFSSEGAMGFGAEYQSNTAPCGFSALVDFLALNGGYAFNSSATLKALTHPAVSTSNTYGNALFYYRRN